MSLSKRARGVQLAGRGKEVKDAREVEEVKEKTAD